MGPDFGRLLDDAFLAAAGTMALQAGGRALFPSAALYWLHSELLQEIRSAALDQSGDEQ